MNSFYPGVVDDSEEEVRGCASGREDAAAWRRALLLVIETQIGNFEDEE
jgi:hypothetical protein